MARTRPGQIFVSWGFHPHYAQDWKDDVAQNFLDGSSATELVALGEIGLDSVRSSAPVEIQLPVFKKMLGVAREAALPVVIHCREAFDALWPALEEHCREGKKPEPYWGVIHCFSGGIEDARKAVELDFVLGVDGPVTYPKNEELRRAVLAAGLENLVLETDSPYLPPQSLRGKRNEPADVALIADFLAGLFGVPAEAVAEATTRAARDLFRLPKE